jgi:hypothetical protein
MKHKGIGFRQDTRSREELERDGFVLQKRFAAPISKADSSVVRVELYMWGGEMVMRVLGPTERIIEQSA